MYRKREDVEEELAGDGSAGGYIFHTEELPGPALERVLEGLVQSKAGPMHFES